MEGERKKSDCRPGRYLNYVAAIWSLVTIISGRLAAEDNDHSRLLYSCKM